jgi:hypothetical protein
LIARVASPSDQSSLPSLVGRFRNPAPK